MSISDRTRKILWARAAGRCSFPDCELELTSLSNSTRNSQPPETIIGEEAHIIAQNLGGTRGNINIEENQKDLYSNLILLCRNHHRIVDDPSNNYTTTMLHDMKQKHENKIELSLNKSQHQHFLSNPYKKLSNHQLIHVWKYPLTHILCFSFGSEPKEISPHRIWKGNGLEFLRTTPPSFEDITSLITITEAEFEIEYQCNDEMLQITQYTYDPRCENLVPFITKIFEHNKETPSMIVRIQPDTSDMSEVIKELSSSKLPKNFEKHFYKLRNGYISNPTSGIKIFNQLKAKNLYDGAVSKCLQDCTNELRLLQSNSLS